MSQWLPEVQVDTSSQKQQQQQQTNKTNKQTNEQTVNKETNNQTNTKQQEKKHKLTALECCWVWHKTLFTNARTILALSVGIYAPFTTLTTCQAWFWNCSKHAHTHTDTRTTTTTTIHTHTHTQMFDTDR
jgi:hypothetical protein